MGAFEVLRAKQGCAAEECTKIRSSKHKFRYIRKQAVSTRMSQLYLRQLNIANMKVAIYAMAAPTSGASVQTQQAFSRDFH